MVADYNAKSSMVNRSIFMGKDCPTDGTYVEWNKGYLLADKPLKLSTPPELVREIK